jgi:hypothetical protein
MVNSIKLIPSVFQGPGKEGDFSWMLAQPLYARALFVFNDNEDQFLAFQRGIEAGGGNAIIRPFQASASRATGIATGPDYDTLDAKAKAIIDKGIQRVNDLLATGAYDMLVYSASASDPSLLGISIFKVGDDVRRYIVSELKRLATN